MSTKSSTGGRHRSTSFKGNENQRAETLAAIAASLTSPLSIATHAITESESEGLSPNVESPPLKSIQNDPFSSYSEINPLYRPAHPNASNDTTLIHVTRPTLLATSESRSDALFPDTPVAPPPFLYNFMSKQRAKDQNPTLDTTSTSSGLQWMDEEEDGSNSQVNEMLEQLSSEAQSSLFWSTWFDSEEQAMFDVNSMLSSIDFNAGHLDAWTKYASEASRSSSPSEISPEAVKDIIIKFLDLPRPIMQESLVQCLLMDGMVEMFVDFISLTTSSLETAPTQIPSDSQNFINEQTLRDREQYLQEEDMRRSFHATNVLSDGAGSAQSLVDRTFTRIVKQLLKTLEPNSKGSLRHFRKLFLELKRNNERLVDIVLEETCIATGRPCIIEMLRYCHEPPIVECIYSLCLHPTSNISKRQRWFEKILESEFIIHLLELLKYHAIIEGVLDLIERLTEGAADCEHGYHLFMPIMGLFTSSEENESTPFILLQLLKQVTDEQLITQKSLEDPIGKYQYGQRIRAIVETLHALYIKSIPGPKSASLTNIMMLSLSNSDPEPDTLSKDPPLNMLRQAIQTFLSKHMALFCKMIFRQGADGKSFAPTSSVLMALEIIHEFIKHGSDAVWKRMQQDSLTYVGLDTTLETDKMISDDFGSVEFEGQKQNDSSGSCFEKDRLQVNALMDGMSTCASSIELGEIKADSISLVPFESIVDWFYSSYSEHSVISARIFKLFEFLIQKRHVYWNICLKSILIGNEGIVKSRGLLRCLLSGYQDTKKPNRGYTSLLLDELRMAYEEDLEHKPTAVNIKGELCSSPLVRLLKSDPDWNCWIPTIELESRRRRQGMWTTSMISKITSAAIEGPVSLPTFNIKPPPAPRNRNSGSSVSNAPTHSRTPALRSGPLNKSWEGLGSSPRNPGLLSSLQDSVDTDDLLNTLDLLSSGATDIDLSE